MANTVLQGAAGQTIQNEGEYQANRFIGTIANNTPSTNPGVFYILRTMDPAVDVDSTGFRDKTTFSRPGRGYNPYDAQQIVIDAAHTTSFQSRPVIQGVVGDVEGYWSYPQLGNAAEVSHIKHYTIGKGSITGAGSAEENIGIYLENGMIGDDKYGLAFYDASAKSIHAGQVHVGGTTNPTETLEVSGGVLAESYSLSGTGGVTVSLTLASYAEMMVVVNDSIDNTKKIPYCFLVLEDENKAQQNTTYNFYPDASTPANSVLMWMASIKEEI